MKFVIPTQELNFLINKCLNVASGKSTIPILSNFLIEAANDELTITATDLTVGIRCFTDAKILEEGATTLPAKRLAQLIRELTALNVEVSANSNEITDVVADSSRFKLNGMSRNEFPSLPNMTGASQFRMKQAHLKEILFRTSFAVSREDNRYVLTGVYMHLANGKAIFAGTDGKRLSKTEIAVQIDPSFSGTFIIPLKAVEEVMKSLSDEGDVLIFLMNDKIGFETTHLMLITKLLVGEYPDVNRVIPAQSEIIVRLHREELMTLLRQIALFTGETVTGSVRFAFTDGELKLTANTMEVGEGKVSMPVNYQGPKLEIAFNPNYFLDILRHTKSQIITLGLTDTYNPGLIREDKDGPQQPDEPDTLYVLMPMRLSEE